MNSEIRAENLTFPVKFDDSLSEDEIAIIDRDVFDRLRYRIELEQIKTVIDSDTVRCKCNIKTYFWFEREEATNG